jgi:hypothetical protein
MSKLEVVARIEELPLSADALDRLEELREARNMLEILIDHAVDECRGNGQARYVDDVAQADGSTVTREAVVTRPVSWQKIADALGMTRQSAWQRFRHNG